jgi:hypothetical protein
MFAHGREAEKLCCGPGWSSTQLGKGTISQSGVLCSWVEAIVIFTSGIELLSHFQDIVLRGRTIKYKKVYVVHYFVGCRVAQVVEALSSNPSTTTKMKGHYFCATNKEVYMCLFLQKKHKKDKPGTYRTE